MVHTTEKLLKNQKNDTVAEEFLDRFDVFTEGYPRMNRIFRFIRSVGRVLGRGFFGIGKGMAGIAEGMARISLFPASSRHPHSVSFGEGFRKDAEALSGDWRKVGDDLRHAMRKFEEEEKKK